MANLYHNNNKYIYLLLLWIFPPTKLLNDTYDIYDICDTFGKYCCLFYGLKILYICIIIEENGYGAQGGKMFVLGLKKFAP